MSDDNQKVGAVDSAAEVVDSQVETGNEVELSPAEMKAELAKMKAAQKEIVAERNMLKKKSADYETKLEVERQAKLEADGKFKELAEAETAKRVAIETKIRDKEVNSAINSALKDLGLDASGLKTAKALAELQKSKVTMDGDEVDQESVTALIDELQREHPVLFTDKKAAKVDIARADHAAPAVKAGSSEKQREFAAIKTQAQLSAYIAKYGTN